jgi:hypothetical protein
MSLLTRRLCTSTLTSRVSAVVSEMRAKAAVPAVQKDGLAALTKLAGPDVNKATIVACRGVEAAVQALRQHTRTDVHISGHSLFGALLDEPSSQRAAVVQAGGVEATIASMRRFEDVQIVQALGCRGLGMIASDDMPSRAAVVDSGGVHAISAALKRHVDAPRAQALGACCWLQASPLHRSPLVCFCACCCCCRG